MGQKTNSYLKKISINKLWKSDANTFSYNNSNLENLFFYFLIKHNLKKYKAKLVKFKIYNTGEKIKFFVSIFFQKTKTKRRLKWWQRKKQAEKKLKYTTKKVIKMRQTSKLKLWSLSKTARLSWHKFNFKNQLLSLKLLNKVKIEKFQPANTYDIRTNSQLKLKQKLKFKKFKNILKLVKFRINLENLVQKYTKKPIELYIQNVMWKISRFYLKSVQQILNSLPQAKKFKNLKTLVKIAIIAILLKNAQFLAEQIALEFQKLRKPNFFLRVLKWFVKELHTKFGSNFIGLSIKIWGKLGKSKRTKKTVVQAGSFGLTNFKTLSDEFIAPCYTRYGVYGIKTTITYDRQEKIKI